MGYCKLRVCNERLVNLVRKTMNDEVNKAANIGSEEDRDLTHALEIFYRYGYRKTSLDDLAQAIGVSRQTLYVRYKNKKNVFELSMINMMDSVFRNCEAAAKDDALNVQEKLIQLIDIWHGKQYRYLQSSPHSAEIIDESMAMIGDFITDRQQAYIGLLEKTLSNSGIPANPSKIISAFNLAEMLYYTSKGICLVHQERDEFLMHVRKTVNVICES